MRIHEFSICVSFPSSRTFDRIITIKIPLITHFEKDPSCSQNSLSKKKKETINFSLLAQIGDRTGRWKRSGRERGGSGRWFDPSIADIGGWRSFEELGSFAGPGKCGFVHGEPGLRGPWGPWRQIPWRGKREATPQPSHPVRPWGRRWRACPRTGDWTRCNRK